MILGVAFLGNASGPQPAMQATQTQPVEDAASVQANREDSAENAFKQIDQAQMNFPPVGGDPAVYNAAITSAYHVWERAAETAYGTDWKSIWRTKHAGGTEGCDIAHKFGMPYDACYKAAASDGDIKPLDSYLMKCPSWDDPSGAIFDPHDPVACATRAKAKAAAAAHAVAASPSDDSADAPSAQTTVPPAQQEVPTDPTTPVETTQQNAPNDQATTNESGQQPQ
jgi:hypothetical protein